LSAIQDPRHAFHTVQTIVGNLLTLARAAQSATCLEHANSTLTKNVASHEVI
jgi:hypothetical protein